MDAAANRAEHSLRRVAQRAAAYGLTVLPAAAVSPAAARAKKYVALVPVRLNGASFERRPVFFGAAGSEDFTVHGDEKKRAAYRARAEGQRLGDGTRAIDRVFSPAWLSYHLLW